jgi:PIN domain nuclease of toxin-antitoxin system
MLNLDTHILLHALNDTLTPSERRLLSINEWSISAIVIWEICKLVQLGRLELDPDDRDFVRLLSRMQVWPIDLPTCRAIQLLDFRGDPADEIIAATSLVNRIPLVTRDARLRKSKVIAIWDR